MKALDLAAEILMGIGATLLFLAFVQHCFTFTP
jgi:hypothetical protein